MAFSSPSSSTKQPNGTATAVGQGGAQPYTYAWRAGTSGATANQLLPGVYTVTATDSRGCTAVTMVEVVSGLPAGTYVWRCGNWIGVVEKI